MKLEEIGFYTLSDERAMSASHTSPLSRCELILTSRCNFKCLYCRGLKREYTGDMLFNKAEEVMALWINEGLKNVRFSGGEPTLYDGLDNIVCMARNGGCEHIAISTNGSAPLEQYERLIKCGVNDFSISLDAGCCATGEKMSGGIMASWGRAVDAIKHLSQKVYVSVGIVFTEQNVQEAVETVKFADSLGVTDIRVIPSAQYNKALANLCSLPTGLLNKYPILNYRIKNLGDGKHVRGIGPNDTNKCSLVLDDMACVGNYHYPCVIYLREQGQPIGEINANMREERRLWYLRHNTHKDAICSKNCLDVCIAYNNKKEEYGKA